ncbi:hypothetical protein Hte_010334 [Hypoxylon texense]
MSTPSVDALALTESLELFNRDLEANLKSLSDDERYKLSEAARKVNLSTEATLDSVHRIVHASLQLPLACIGVEAKIFDILSNVEGTLTIAKLAEKTNVDPALMKRLLRYYQSFGMVTQDADDAFSANNVTKAMTTIAGRSGAPFFLYGHATVWSSLPRFLRETGYVNPTEPTGCPWYAAHNTQDPVWEWISKRPERLENMMSWMQGQRHGLPIFLDAVDFSQYAQGATDSTPIFVDVGGNRGHQCINLKQRYPNLRGRIIVQDQPHVIEEAKANPLPGFDDIEAHPQDIFTPQKIKGARVYYMRYILHDWPDRKCVEILKNLRAGMTEESTIFIDEMVMPERGASWRAAQMDFVMACCFASTERSLPEFEALLNEAGLKIAKVYQYTKQLNDCIIAAVIQ